MLEKLEEKLGYTFQDKRLLEKALTHSSYANEIKPRRLESNERLEFLGDAVLGVVSAEYLYFHHTHVPEGELTRLRASMVCEHALHGFALSIGLGGWLKLGRGEENSGGRERSSILADAFESVIAAIYLDGGLPAAKKFVTRFADSFFSAHKEESARDYKTELQEYAQKSRDEKLDYVLTGESGPDHDKQFTVEVRLDGRAAGTGNGGSKKEAEQAAAREALSHLTK